MRSLFLFVLLIPICCRWSKLTMLIWLPLSTNNDTRRDWWGVSWPHVRTPRANGSSPLCCSEVVNCITDMLCLDSNLWACTRIDHMHSASFLKKNLACELLQQNNFEAKRFNTFFVFLENWYCKHSVMYLEIASLSVLNVFAKFFCSTSLLEDVKVILSDAINCFNTVVFTCLFWSINLIFAVLA